MATTVTYKDNTLTTLGNGDTKTLKTAGTYLEDDIEISEVVNLQTKTVTPTTSQQVVTADSYTDFIVPAGTHFNTSTSIYLSGNLNTLISNLYTFNYIKLNGKIKVSNYQYNTATYQYYQLVTVNSIIPLQETSSSNKYSISYTTIENTNNGGSNLVNAIDVYKSGNSVIIGITLNSNFDTYETKSFELIDMTISYGNHSTLDTNADGLEQVTVGAIPSNYVIPTGTKTITSNGTGIDVAAYATVNVSVAGAATSSYQSKSVTPTESSQTVTADSGYDALSSVTVGAISSTYVGSGITQRTASDITFTKAGGDAYYTIPAGYYASKVEEDLLTVNHPNPTVSVNSATGLITASHTQTSGYVYTGGTTTGTSQLSVQAATTITPTTSSQTAVAAGKYTTGAVTVAAIPSNYVDSTTLRTYRSGTSAPASSLGNNGDIYLQLAQ